MENSKSGSLRVTGVLRSGGPVQFQGCTVILVTEIASHKRFPTSPPPPTSCQYSFATGRSIRHACPVRGVVDLAAARSTQYRIHRSTGENGNASQPLLLNLSLQTDPCRQTHVAQCPSPRGESTHSSKLRYRAESLPEVTSSIMARSCSRWLFAMTCDQQPPCACRS